MVEPHAGSPAKTPVILTRGATFSESVCRVSTFDGNKGCDVKSTESPLFSLVSIIGTVSGYSRGSAGSGPGRPGKGSPSASGSWVPLHSGSASGPGPQPWLFSCALKKSLLFIGSLLSIRLSHFQFQPGGIAKFMDLVDFSWESVWCGH